MGEVENIVNIYLEESGLIEDKVKEIWETMRLNWDKLLYEGHGRRTGTLLSDLQLNTIYNYNDKQGTVEGRYTVPYGSYIDLGGEVIKSRNNSFEGYHFMKDALEMILSQYGGSM